LDFKKMIAETQKLQASLNAHAPMVSSENDVP